MKKHMIWSVLLLALGICHAQKSPTDYPEVVPPAPSVASLMRFEEVPVDYYTGQPNISIPLGNVSINKDLSYPIALQYNTQAIRIEERSGWTGTGFSMSTGGVISRTIQGIPDELNTQYGGIGMFHLTEMIDFYALSSSDQTKFLWETNNGETKKDAMYDLFQYSFFGNSGRFIIEKTTSGLQAKIIGNETNHKVEVFYDVNFNLTSFKITDTKGYIYTFDETNQNLVETITITSAQFTGQGSNVSTATTDMTGGQNVPNAWYLTKVESPVQVNNAHGNPEHIIECTFTYAPVTENYNIPTTYATNKIIGNPNFGGNTTTEDTNKGMTLPKTVEVSQKVTSTQKYVSSVTTRDGSKVEYSFSSGHPEFLLGGAKLNSIIIREPNGDVHKELEFSYQTTTHNRLFLTTIKEKFGADELVYSLDYNNEDILPAFDRSKQDQWGYYRDNLDPFLASPDDAAIGVLSSITYPTGGKKEFVFESNSYAFIGSTPVDSLDIASNYTTVSYGDQFYYNESLQLSPSVSQDKYIVYVEPNSTLELFIQKVSENTSGSSSFSYDKHKIRFVSVSPTLGSGISTPPTGSNGGYNASDFYDDGGTDYDFDITFGTQGAGMTSGWYMAEIYTPQPQLYNNSWDFTLEVALKVREFQLNTYNQLGGGIRIKEILFKDQAVTQKKIEYSYNEDHFIGEFGGISDLKSSGSFEYDPNNRSYTRYISHPFVDNNCGANQINIVPTTLQYQMSISRNQSVTPNTKGNYIGYKYIVRRESGNGSERYTYISPRDVQILTSQNTSYPFKPVENSDYKRGVLSKKQIVDESSRTLEEEDYLYTDVNTIVKTSIFPYEASIGGGTCVWDQFYLNYNNYLNNWVDNPITSCGSASGGPNTYQNCDGNSDMAVMSYNHTIGILLPNTVTKKQYYYEGTNSIASNIVTTTQKMTYNAKYRIASQTTEMNKGGAIEELKKEIHYPYNIPSGSGFDAAEIAVFNQMNALNIIADPVMIINRRNTDIISVSRTSYANFSIDNYRPSKTVAFKGGEIDEIRIDFSDYDDQGNLLQVAKEEGTEVVYIWGYDGTLPIAKIENAKLTDIPTLIYNDVVNKSNLDHVSNTTVTENDLRTALQTLRNDASMSGAMITTFTYDPMVGVTSITDARGETIFYQYDTHHRLKLIKDSDGNILSENTYHYKN